MQISNSPNFYENSPYHPPLASKFSTCVEKIAILVKKVLIIAIGILFPPLGIYWVYKSFKQTSWIDQIPDTIHYNAFNHGSSVQKATQARLNMKNLIHSFGGSFSKWTKLAGSLPHWTMPPLSKLKDQDTFSCGAFPISGKELKKMTDSLQVSYDSSVVDPKTLQTILTKGSSGQKMEAQARGRMVSSLAASVSDSLGNPLKRTQGPLPFYRVYTSHAPNLAYNAYDRADFIEHGQFNQHKYLQEMQRLFVHFFKDAKSNGDEVIVIPGFGLGAFMTDQLKPQAQKCFIQALRNAIQSEGLGFKSIIFANPTPDLVGDIEKMANANSLSKVIATTKSSLDVAHHAAKRGEKVALFNPGDGSGIPGQFWAEGHVALEEMFGLFTTLLIGQHPCCNPKVGDKANYKNVNA